MQITKYQLVPKTQKEAQEIARKQCNYLVSARGCPLCGLEGSDELGVCCAWCTNFMTEDCDSEGGAYCPLWRKVQ